MKYSWLNAFRFAGVVKMERANSIECYIHIWLKMFYEYGLHYSRYKYIKFLGNEFVNHSHMVKDNYKLTGNINFMYYILDKQTLR